MSSETTQYIGELVAMGAGAIGGAWLGAKVGKYGGETIGAIGGSFVGMFVAAYIVEWLKKRGHATSGTAYTLQRSTSTPCTSCPGYSSYSLVYTG